MYPSPALVYNSKMSNMVRRLVLPLICLVLFLVDASAQENPFPNELEGLQFSKQNKFKDLKFLASTKSDVTALFGKDCAYGCNYDDDWRVVFSYLTSRSAHAEVQRGQHLVFEIRPEFVGKLAIVDLKPRRPVILPETVVFPADLECDTRNGAAQSMIKVCGDTSRLLYQVYAEADAGGKYQKNEIIMITYNASAIRMRNVFESVPRKLGR